MSQAQDRHMSIHDLPKVGMVAMCFNNDDLSKLPVRIQNEVRQSKIEQLEAIERSLEKIEFGDRHPFGRKEYEELTKLRAEQAAAISNPPRQQAPAPAPAPDNSSPVTGGGIQFQTNMRQP